MMKKSITPLLLTAALAALALTGSGCSSVSDMPQAADQDRNFFNIVKIEPDSFLRSSPSTLEIHSNDIISQPNVSGTRVTLLSGLFTYEDY